MKNVLFATTATSALLLGGIASAQGIALFGSARLGLGYNIDNEGNVVIEDGDTPDDLRAVSRVRFGVNMTGETDSGITFGATIRADNAIGGEGDAPLSGQTDGSVFVSGAWGTLTYGDTNGADEQWVGDVPGDFSLTGLGEFDETRFISNGGDFGEGGSNFAANPEARPTVRYDFDIMGFGLSLSSNRDLTDIVVGTGYAADFGGGSWSVGAGYNNFEGFDVVGDAETAEVDVCVAVDPVTGLCILEPVLVPVAPVTATLPDGEQWSLALKGEYETFGFGVTYTNLDASSDETGDFKADELLIGATAGWDAWSFGLIYGNILSADGVLDSLDGDDSWQLSAQYDLGGGATVNTGVRWTYDIVGLGGDDDEGGDQATIADFGIKMEF